MKLFEPGKIGTMELKNRILMAPMGIGALAEPDGRLSQRAIEYYAARARGGAGMIITGITCVDVEIENKVERGLGVFARADHPVHIHPLSELADAVHDCGAKLCVQLTAGLGRVAYGGIMRGGHARAGSFRARASAAPSTRPQAMNGPLPSGPPGNGDRSWSSEGDPAAWRRPW